MPRETFKNIILIQITWFTIEKSNTGDGDEGTMITSLTSTNVNRYRKGIYITAKLHFKRRPPKIGNQFF